MFRFHPLLNIWNRYTTWKFNWIQSIAYVKLNTVCQGLSYLLFYVHNTIKSTNGTKNRFCEINEFSYFSATPQIFSTHSTVFGVLNQPWQKSVDNILTTDFFNFMPRNEYKYFNYCIHSFPNICKKVLGSDKQHSKGRASIKHILIKALRNCILCIKSYDYFVQYGFK